MKLIIHPEKKDMVLQGKKTSNILHGMQTDTSVVRFLTQNSKEVVKEFALAECTSLTHIQFIPKSRQIFFYIEGHWQPANQNVKDELIKSEGLKNEKELWALIKKPFQGTFIQWGRIMPILTFEV